MDRFFSLLDKITTLENDYLGQFDREPDRTWRQKSAPALFDRARELLAQVDTFLKECGDDIAPGHADIMARNKKKLERIRDATGNPFLKLPTITVPEIQWPDLPPGAPILRPVWKT